MTATIGEVKKLSVMDIINTPSWVLLGLPGPPEEGPKTSDLPRSKSVAPAKVATLTLPPRATSFPKSQSSMSLAKSLMKPKPVDSSKARSPPSSRNGSMPPPSSVPGPRPGQGSKPQLVKSFQYGADKRHQVDRTKHHFTDLTNSNDVKKSGLFIEKSSEKTKRPEILRSSITRDRLHHDRQRGSLSKSSSIGDPFVQDKQFRSDLELLTKRIASKTGDVKCAKCATTLEPGKTSDKVILAHLLTHLPPSFKCSLCNKKITQMRAHFQSAHPKEKFDTKHFVPIQGMKDVFKVNFYECFPLIFRLKKSKALKTSQPVEEITLD